MLVETVGLVLPPMISRLTEELVNRRSTKIRLTQLEDDIRHMLAGQQQLAINDIQLRRTVEVLVRLLTRRNPGLFYRQTDALMVTNAPETSSPDSSQLSIALSQYIEDVTAAVERRRQRIASTLAGSVPSDDPPGRPRSASGMLTIDDALEEFGRDFDERIAQRRLLPPREERQCP